MSYRKNTAGQKVNVLAIDSTTGQPVTGDAANITAQISLDFGAAAAIADTNPTELDAINFAGIYVFDLTQAETNGDVLTIQASSATSNVLFDIVNIYTVVVDDYKADVADIATALTTIENEIDNIKVVTDALPNDGALTDIDSNIDAIKVKTDQMVFTVANQVDANALTGGSSSDPIGPGSINTELEIQSAGQPVDNAAVWITTDAAGTNVIAGTLYTNMNGEVSFMLDAGSYYVWASRSGVQFPNPTALTVT